MKFPESTPIENIEPGSYIGRLYSLIDLGSQLHSWAGEQWVSRDVRMSFELPTELMEGLYNLSIKGRPFAVHTTVKQSLHAASKLRQLLESWRGRKFTKEEAATFDPKKLIGLPCRLALVENDGYINISSISPLGKNEKCPPPVNPSVFLSLESGEFDQAVFDKLHEKTREKIMKTTEYHALTSGAPQPSADDVPHNEPDSTSEPF